MQRPIKHPTPSTVGVMLDHQYRELPLDTPVRLLVFGTEKPTYETLGEAHIHFGPQGNRRGLLQGLAIYMGPDRGWVECGFTDPPETFTLFVSLTMEASSTAAYHDTPYDVAERIQDILQDTLRNNLHALGRYVFQLNVSTKPPSLE